MRKKILIIILILAGNMMYAQSPDIVAMEYYFDQDPGFGNATNVPVVAGSTIDLNFSADVSGISTGFHRIYIRAKDATGKWSLTYKRDIYKTDVTPVPPVPVPNLVAMEYFFDHDPGFGNGVPVAVLPGNIIDTNFSAIVSGISAGFHRVYLRAKDETGKWSLTYKRDIYKTNVAPIPPLPIPNLVAMEYFFDHDPGFGNGVPVAVLPGNMIDTNFSAIVSGISAGFHRVYLRAKDATGKWGLTYKRDIYKTNVTPTPPLPMPNLVAMEYFFDHDPGFGNGVPVAMTPEMLIDKNISVDISSVGFGTHNFYLRVKDETGKWGFPYIQSITIEGLQTDTIHLLSGWNLISFDVAPDNNTTADVFAPLISNNNLVYVSGYQNQFGVFFDPNGLSFLNTLQNIYPGEGYWVKVNNASLLIVEGAPIAANFSIGLALGWNLIGYWPKLPKPPEVAFAELKNLGILDYVSGYKNGGVFYDPNGLPFLNTLILVENGYGYWAKMNTAFNNFIYPASN